MTDHREIKLSLTGTVSYPNTKHFEMPEQAVEWLESEMQKELEKLLLITGPVYYTDRWRGRLIDRANEKLKELLGEPKVEIEVLTQYPSKDK